MAISLSAFLRKLPLSNGTTKRAAKEKDYKNCHRSGGAIASTADTKCFFGGKTQEIIAQFDSYDTVLVAYEESAKQGEKVN